MTDNISKEKAQAYGISVPPTKQGDTLSPNQIAKILGVSGARVRIWINTGRLSAVRRPNGYWVVTVSDLERFLESRQRVRLRVLFNGPSSVKQKIEQLGYEVVEATNLTDALLKLASVGVSLIILEVASKGFLYSIFYNRRNDLS